MWEYVQNLGLSLQSRKRFPQFYFISIWWNCSEVSKQDGWFPLAKIFFKNTRETFISHPHYHKGTFFFCWMVPKHMNKACLLVAEKLNIFFQLSFMWMIFFPVSVLFYIKSIFHAKQSIHGTSGAGLVWFWLHKQFPKFSPFVTSFLPVRFSPRVFIHRCLSIYTLNWFKFHVPSTLKLVR